MAGEAVEYEYTCGNNKALEYYILGDDIRKEFDFLTDASSNGIPNKLTEMLKELKEAANNVTAFKFENGASVNSLEKAYQEIDADVANIRSALSVLHSAIMTDIDNVNAELDANFGYWIGRKLFQKESKKN